MSLACRFFYIGEKARTAKLPDLESIGEDTDKCSSEDDSGEVH